MTYNELSERYNRCLDIKYEETNNDANYAYEVKDNILYIYFEMSNSVKDWISNFTFPATPYKDMDVKWYCHRGFLQVWRSIKDKIYSVIMDPSIKSIIITGYSHGAAIAAFAHEYAWYNRPDIRDNIVTYAFGAPRVYFGFMKKSLKHRWDRFYPIRNAQDIVTHVPPAIFGFRHVNKIFKIGKGKWYGPINSHRPKSYIASLKDGNDNTNT